MVCIKVIGNHNGITMAGSHGHFELNVFKPLIIHNVLQSLDILSDATKNFSKYCVKGLKANKKRIKELLDNSLMLVTALSPKIGYDNAAKIAKLAHQNNTTLKTEAVKLKLISEKELPFTYVDGNYVFIKKEMNQDVNNRLDKELSSRTGENMNNKDLEELVYE